MAAAAADKVYRLQCNDDETQTICVNEYFIQSAITLRDVVSDLGDEDVIPVYHEHATLENLDMIKTFYSMHEGEPIPEPPENHEEAVVRPWSDDDNALAATRSAVEKCSVYMLSDYLNTQLFSEFMELKIAEHIKGKSTESIRDTFQIVNDFTPEEEAEIKKELEWDDTD